jgi:hypothetical protein
MVYCKVDPCYCRSTISPRTWRWWNGV